MNTRKKKIERIQISLGGFLFILNGISLLENHPKIASLLLVFGVLLLLYIGAVALKIPQHPVIRPLMFSMEGIGFLAASYILFETGKVYLPYFYLLGGLLCFFAIYMNFRRTKREKANRASN